MIAEQLDVFPKPQGFEDAKTLKLDLPLRLH